MEKSLSEYASVSTNGQLMVTGKKAVKGTVFDTVIIGDAISEVNSTVKFSGECVYSKIVKKFD